MSTFSSNLQRPDWVPVPGLVGTFSRKLSHLLIPYADMSQLLFPKRLDAIEGPGIVENVIKVRDIENCELLSMRNLREPHSRPAIPAVMLPRNLVFKASFSRPLTKNHVFQSVCPCACKTCSIMARRAIDCNSLGQMKPEAVPAADLCR